MRRDLATLEQRPVRQLELRRDVHDQRPEQAVEDDHEAADALLRRRLVDGQRGDRDDVQRVRRPHELPVLNRDGLVPVGRRMCHQRTKYHAVHRLLPRHSGHRELPKLQRGINVAERGGQDLVQVLPKLQLGRPGGGFGVHDVGRHDVQVRDGLLQHGERRQTLQRVHGVPFVRPANWSMTEKAARHATAADAS